MLSDLTAKSCHLELSIFSGISISPILYGTFSGMTPLLGHIRQDRTLTHLPWQIQILGPKSNIPIAPVENAMPDF